jgi:hypothetical protein
LSSKADQSSTSIHPDRHMARFGEPFLGIRKVGLF